MSDWTLGKLAELERYAAEIQQEIEAEFEAERATDRTNAPGRIPSEIETHAGEFLARLPRLRRLMAQGDHDNDFDDVFYLGVLAGLLTRRTNGELNSERARMIARFHELTQTRKAVAEYRARRPDHSDNTIKSNLNERFGPRLVRDAIENKPS